MAKILREIKESFSFLKSPFWWALATVGSVVGIAYDHSKDWNVNRLSYTPVDPGLVWINENLREYVGPARKCPAGIERDIYVDWKPFGSLDGVKIMTCSDSGRIYRSAERKPKPGEEETLRLLEYNARKEHPVLFERFNGERR